MAKFIRNSGPYKGKSLIGLKFGRWLVLNFCGYFLIPKSSPRAAWLCKCECGRYGIRDGSYLKSGSTKSCGCLLKTRINIGNTRHGGSGTGIHKKWIGMMRRCENLPDGPYWERYGSRGIKVCERWQVFENFRDDMGPTLKPGLSLERINNDGDYCPENCRWATPKEQANNRRTNMLITYSGRTLTSSQWETETGIKAVTIRKRLKDGWSEAEALSTPTRKGSYRVRRFNH